MKHYLKPYWPFILLAVFSVSVAAGATLAQPQIFQIIINDGIAATGGANQAIIRDYGIVLIVIGVVGLAAGMLNTIISAKIAVGITTTLREEAFAKIQTFSYANIDAFSTSNLVVRLTNDMTQIQNFIMMAVQSLLQVPIILGGSIWLALRLLPDLWWVIVVLIVTVLLLLAIAMTRAVPFFKKLQINLDQVNTIIKENFEGVRVVKSFVQEEYENKRFMTSSTSLSKITISIGYIFSTVIPLFMLFANLASVGAIYVASDAALTDPAVVGSIVSFISYLFQIMAALILAGTLLITVSRAMVSIRRVKEILHTEPSIVYGSETLPAVHGAVTFDNVSFAYPNDDVLTLKNVSFQVNPGEFVGIIGATGSGKTTLVQLLARLYDPSKGSIYLDDVPLTALSKKTLRNTIAIVLQQAMLFSGTVRQNIQHGKLSATDDEVERAAGLAQASEFIERLQGRYDADVLQRGSNFSGGQKQRISLARGIVNNPKVLILDDSTSALDARSEMRVREALDSEFMRTTTFMIAQKITSVLHADKIIVLDEGQVSAVGTHEELMKKSLVYQEIYATQIDQGGEAHV
ncbi:MAG: ABC transporter ATP-binding protein [Culicoidibacterales bacterium]